MRYSDDGSYRDHSEHRRRRRRRSGWSLAVRPWWIIYLLGAFVVEWCSSRRWAAFAAGLPAALVALVPLIGLAVSRHQGDASLYERYWSEARAALDSKDYENAGLLLQRLTSMRPHEHAAKYLLAVCAEEQNQPARARQLMHQIAPLDGGGYAEAHFWLARDLTKSRERIDTKVAQQVERHLVAALEANEKYDPARKALTQFYVDQERVDDAVKVWAPMNVRGVGYWLTLAQLQTACGRERDAIRSAGQAVDACQRRLDEQPGDAMAYTVWAKAESLRGEHQAAVNALFEGLKHCEPSTHERIRSQIAITYAAWYDSAPEDNLDQRLELIGEAMRFGPDEPAVLVRLAALTMKLDKGTEAFEPLHRALTEGTAPAAVHLLLGTAAIETHPETAIKHLKIALEHQPQSFATLNNLAWTLAHLPDPDLETAEKLVDAASELAPQHIEIRDTRGRIRAKRGNLEGAIADLEFVIRQDPNRIPALKLLSELYGQVGLDDLASTTRAKIEASQ